MTIIGFTSDIGGGQSSPVLAIFWFMCMGLLGKAADFFRTGIKDLSNIILEMLLDRNTCFKVTDRFIHFVGQNRGSVNVHQPTVGMR